MYNANVDDEFPPPYKKVTTVEKALRNIEWAGEEVTTTALFMNVLTGSIDTEDGWDDFDYWRDAGILTEVRSTTAEEVEEHGKWIEV